MEYQHHTENGNNFSRAFKIGIAINIIFVILEIIFGFLSNSMALVADAGHNFSDVLALAFSWVAIRLSQARPTLRFTYGLRRSTILIALFNTILLVIAMLFLLIETISRLGNTVAINSTSVIIVACLGIVVNGFTAWLFFKGKSHDLNIRSAFLHFVADALVSMGVVAGGVLMYYTGVFWIDSVVSFVVIAIILYSTYRLLVDTVSLALDAVPGNIDIDAVRSYLENLTGVSGIHDLHIWALSTNVVALTVHIQTSGPTDLSFINNVQIQLKERFGIEHTTIQIEFGDQGSECNDCN
jgi:cobalt-zinc-cadmium efflux system protein